MLRVRRVVSSSLAVFLLTLGALSEPARAQDPVRLGPYVIDVRGALPRFGQNAFLAAQRGLETLQLPASGLGLDVGAHIYPLRWRAVTFGVGVQALFSRGERVPTLEELAALGGTTAEDPLAPIQTRFTSIGPQLSLNFGGTTGWSYLSGGLGQTTFNVDPVGVERDDHRFSTINYGGGGRWFAKDHLAFSLDLRFYAISPQEETDDFPGLPRMALMVFSLGVSFK